MIANFMYVMRTKVAFSNYVWMKGNMNEQLKNLCSDFVSGSIKNQFYYID